MDREVNIQVTGAETPTTTPMNLKQIGEKLTEMEDSIDRHGDERPTLTTDDVGYMMFDVTLGKPIWWNGTDWVDAYGETIDTD